MESDHRKFDDKQIDLLCEAFAAIRNKEECMDFLEDLMTIFPRVQFIVTTHAPIVINSIRSDNLILLRDNQPERAGLEVYGKDANSIIQSVMRSNERPERVKKMLEDFYSAVDEGKLDKARTILTTIEDDIGTDDPEAAACEVQLSLEEA